MVEFEKRKIYCLAEILSSLDYYQGLRTLLKEQINDTKEMEKKDKKLYEKTLKKDLDQLDRVIYSWESVLVEISKFSSLKVLNFVKDVLNYSFLEQYIVIPGVSGCNRNRTYFENDFNILNESFCFDILTTYEAKERLDKHLEQNKKHLETVLELKLALNDPNSIFLRSNSNVAVLDGIHCAQKFETFSNILHPLFCRLVDLKLKNSELTEDEIFDDVLKFAKGYIKIKR